MREQPSTPDLMKTGLMSFVAVVLFWSFWEMRAINVATEATRACVCEETSDD